MTNRVIGYITEIQGSYIAKTADGSVKQLALGGAVYEDDIVMGTGGINLVIELVNGGTPLVLDGNVFVALQGSVDDELTYTVEDTKVENEFLLNLVNNNQIVNTNDESQRVASLDDLEYQRRKSIYVNPDDTVLNVRSDDTNNGSNSDADVVRFTLLPTQLRAPVTDLSTSVTVDLDNTTDTGFSSADNITHDNTPAFNGTGEAGSTVVLKVGDQTLETVVGSDGTWSITTLPLNDGDYTILATATDPSGNQATASQLLTIDTVALVGTDSVGVDEDTVSSAGDLLANDENNVTFDGLINGSSHSDGSFTVVGMYGTLVVDKNGLYRYTLDNEVQKLQEGELGEENFSYSVKDIAGNTATSTLTITITGTNDAPVITTLGTVNATENGSIVNGTITSTDSDDNATVNYTTPSTVAGFTLNANGNYSFDPSVSAYNNLAVGATQTLVIPVTATDDQGATTTQNLTITITGTNDAPVITTLGTVNATENGSIVNGTITSTDSDDNATVNYTTPSTVAGFTLNTNGNYSFDPSVSAYNNLAVGATQTLVIPVTATDDQGATTTQNLTITITGTNDTPVAVVDSGFVTTEDSVLMIDVADLLANDSDGDDQSSVTLKEVDSVAKDENGTIVGSVELVVVNGVQQLKFTPNDNLDSLNATQNKNITFGYTAVDEHGATSSSSAQVSVSGLNNDLTFIEEGAAYSNVIGYYEVVGGIPVNPATVVIDNQNGLSGGLHLADLSSNKEYGFFILPDAANAIDATSQITFDSLGNLSVNGVVSSLFVFHDNAAWNKDGEDHFKMVSDGKGGTTIYIEDLSLGDGDFNDVVLHSDIALSNKVFVTTDVDSSSDTGRLNNDNITNDTTPTFTGNTEANATVSVYATDGTTLLVSGVANNQGDYSLTVPANKALAQGTHTVVITSTGTDGIIATTTQTLSVDTSTPTGLAITDIKDESASGDYSLVTMEGTGESGAIITLLALSGSYASDAASNNGTTGSYVTVATPSPIVVGADGKWSVDISNIRDSSGNILTPINDNEFFKATQTDLAGNVSTATSPLHYWHGSWGAANTETGDDYIVSGGGDDTLNMVSDDANNRVVVDGGAGNDKVVYTVAHDTITSISLNNDGEISLLESNGDLNIFRNVETIRFSDGEYRVVNNTLTYIPNNAAPVINTVDTTAVEDNAQVIAHVSDSDGTFSLTSSSALHGTLSMNGNGDILYTPTANYSGTDTVQLSVTDNLGAVTTKTFAVSVAAVADAPVMDATVGAGSTVVVSAVQVSQYTLSLHSALTDLDGSETLSAITLTGIPSGTSLSVGTHNSDGSWTIPVTGNTFNSTITMNVPLSVTNGFMVNATVVSTEAAGGNSSLTKTFEVSMQPTLVNGDSAQGNEDVASIGGNVLTNDSDADSALSVQSFTVNGATYTAGTTVTLASMGSFVLNSNGSYQFSPLSNYSGTLPQVGYTTNTGSSSTLSMSITPDADTTTIALSSLSAGVDLTEVNLVSMGSFESGVSAWSGATAAIAGSGALQATQGTWYLDLSSATNGAISQTIGNVMTQGKYSVTFDYIDQGALNGNTATGAFKVFWGGEEVASFDGDTTTWSTYTIEVVGGNGDGSNKLEIKDVGTSGDSMGMIVDNISMTTTDPMISYSFNVDARLSDHDGSEQLSITFAVPKGALLSDGVDNGNGTWTISAPAGEDYIRTVGMQVPVGTPNFTLQASAKALESGNGDFSTSSVSMSVTVPVTEHAPTTTDDSVTTREDTPYTFTINDFGTFGDVDSGDTFQAIKLETIPTNGVLEVKGWDGHVMAVGDVINIADIQAGNLIFKPLFNSDSDVSFNFKVTDGLIWSDPHKIDVAITAVADAPVVSLLFGSATHVDAVSTPMTLSDTFNSNDGSWTGGTLQSSGPFNKSYQISNDQLKDNTITKTFSLGQEYAGKTVTIDLSIQDTGGWESSGTSADHLYIKQVNTLSNATTTLADYVGSSWNGANANHTSNLSYTGVVDANGNVKLSIQSKTTDVAEKVYLDTATITYTQTTPGYYTYPITVSSALGADKDGSETLSSVTLTGLPSGATVSDGVTTYAVSSGVATLPTGMLNLTVTVPESSNQNFSLAASVTSTESRDGSSYTVSATDTIPSAVAETATVEVENEAITNVATPVTNLVLTVDVSGSMDSAVGNSTRMALTKVALNNMIDSYDSLGDVNVKVITFSTTGSASNWMSAAQAKTYISGLVANGYTNYEDATYKTAYNYAASAPSADKTVSVFISDGEPTRENNLGGDKTGNVGTDSESGWFDTTYQQGWNTFVDSYVDELKVIGIGTGLTNFTYLDAVASAIPGTLALQVGDVTQLADIINPLTTTVTGNILDNVSWGEDGAAISGGCVGMTIDGVTYSAAQLSAGVTTTQGFLVVNSLTGDYSLKVTNANAVDSTKTMSVTVEDGDGSRTTFAFTTTVHVTNMTAPTSPIISSIVDDTTDSDKSTVVVSGTAVAGSVITLIVDGVSTGTSTTNASGVWSTKLDVTNGLHNIVTTATLNGTTSTKSDPSVVSVNNAFVSTTGGSADYVAVDSTALTAKIAGGNDVVVGGTSSADTLEFSGNKSHYTVTHNTSTGYYTIVDNRAGSPDGTDTFKGIEKLKFADQTINVVVYSTPLMLDIDGNGVHTSSIDGNTHFDINNDNLIDRVGWSDGTDAFLARDVNKDGVINDGGELFGGATQLADGSIAKDGFEALRDLDSNHDGKIDATDGAWSELSVWQDKNKDGVSEESELSTLNQAGIKEIHLAHTLENEVDNGNIIGMEGSFTTTDGETHQMVDVWFETQNIDMSNLTELADSNQASSSMSTDLVALNDILDIAKDDEAIDLSSVIPESSSSAVTSEEGEDKTSSSDDVAYNELDSLSGATETIQIDIQQQEIIVQ